jgi:hypothetical protein
MLLTSDTALTHLSPIAIYKNSGDYTLTKAKVWERYGKVWAIYDPYVGMIWDSIDIMWDWYGV